MSAARAVVAQHAGIVGSPKGLTDAPQLHDAAKDFVFGGYAVAFLELAVDSRHADATALTLNKLLASSKLTETSRLYAMRLLLSVMLSRGKSISPATRAVVADALVSAATGEDTRRARHAIGMIAMLVQGQHLDVRSVLDPERRQKLVENFRRLYAEEMNKAQYAVLRSQLGIQ
jgi:hypothetical protein